MKKTLAALLCVVMLCGCNGNIDLIGEVSPQTDLIPVEGGEIRLFCVAPDTLNPIVTGYKSVCDVMYLVYDGLFVTENDFSATPSLASGYTVSDNNTRYVVNIKSGIKFHNGTTLGAEDVVATVNNIRKYNSQYSENIKNVKSCTAKENNSVVFELATPQVNFVSLLDFPIVPSEVIAGDYAAENPYFKPVGTGKFKVKTADQEKLVLCKNQDYYGDRPYIDTITISYVQDTSIAKYSFEAMEFDFITTDLYSWGDTSMSGDFTTNEYESNRLTYLGFNCTNSILSDVTVRRAVSAATDKPTIIQDVMYTHGALTDCPINPNAYFADKEYMHEIYEEGKANSILKSVGWLDLDGDNVLDKYFNEEQLSMKFNLIVNMENNISMQLAEYLQKQLEVEGIFINIVELPFDQYVAAVEKGEFDMFIGRTDISNDCNVSFMLGSGSDKNYFKYSSSAMDAALENIQNASDDQAVKGAYKAFDAVFKDELPFVPLYFETDTLFSSVRIKGNMNISRTGVFTDMSKIFVKYEK